jgi:hypothetical protein
MRRHEDMARRLTPSNCRRHEPQHVPLARAAAGRDNAAMRAGRPWWQATRTASGGFVMGAVWTGFGLAGLAFAVNQIVRHPPGGEPWWQPMSLAAGSLVLGGWYLASSVVLRRRERSGTRPAA